MSRLLASHTMVGPVGEFVLRSTNSRTKLGMVHTELIMIAPRVESKMGRIMKISIARPMQCKVSITNTYEEVSMRLVSGSTTAFKGLTVNEVVQLGKEKVLKQQIRTLRAKASKLGVMVAK